MPEFDSTKRAIGVGKLDDSARKEMFNKFVSAGGEIIKEKPDPTEEAKRNRPEVKTRQGTVSRGGSQDDSRSRSRSNSGRGDGKNQGSGDFKGSSDSKADYEKEISSFMARFSIKLKCWLARVTSFGSPDLLPGFMHDLASRAKEALIECNYAANEILGNSTHSPAVSQALDKINPMLVELIAMAQKLYNGPDLTDISEPIMSAPESPVSIERVKSPIYTLFRKMYILYPYQETLKKSFLQAYDELQKVEGKPSLIYASKKKKVTSEIDVLFNTFFEKLYLVVIRAENKNIPLISRYMENLLDIQPEDKPGMRKTGENVPGGIDPKQKAEEEKERKKEEQAEKEAEKEEVPLSKEQAYGLRLMQMYSIPKLRKKFDPKNDLHFVPDTDKAMLAYLYFREFDEEYSFVLTTKKIDIKLTHVNGVKVDYRQKMLDLYESTRSITDQFKIYLDVMRELEKHKANPGANYIEASKKLSGIEQKRTGQSRTVRMITKDFTQKARDILLEFIKDMKTKKEIIANMNDVITLDAMEAKKRLNKKQIKQCIMESYCYAMALTDRIESGDLYGGLVELTPEQMKESFGVDITNTSEEGATTDETNSASTGSLDSDPGSTNMDDLGQDSSTEENPI
ncbi:hypothetical protein LPTSP4_06460 [Leptospira ryugenii]|uniref:Uncharacterized protein n=1 Tax=Leptospira ryugenii TaxID=1917863 RepID=A0A2P2DWZ8_9LEPT|nr:hypothetical protein [Leptospira ryugenii]GBF49136.1 hypothetical protein LPTSP4_06460 [Leptospira ryugenii]